LTSFRRRQELAAQSGGVAEPEEDPGGPGLWHPRRRHRTDEQRRQQAEADAEEARSAMLAADAQLTEALAAKAATEQELDRARKARGLRPTSGGSMLDDLANDVYDAMAWLL